MVFEGGVIFGQGRDDLSHPGYTHHDEQLHVHDESGFDNHVRHVTNITLIIIKNSIIIILMTN